MRDLTEILEPRFEPIGRGKTVMDFGILSVDKLDGS
jgi:hypothetical protein